MKIVNKKLTTLLKEITSKSKFQGLQKYMVGGVWLEAGRYNEFLLDVIQDFDLGEEWTVGNYIVVWFDDIVIVMNKRTEKFYIPIYCVEELLLAVAKDSRYKNLLTI